MFLKEKSFRFVHSLFWNMLECSVSSLEQWTILLRPLYQQGFLDICTESLQISSHSWRFCLSVPLQENTWQRQKRWTTPSSLTHHLPPSDLGSCACVRCSMKAVCCTKQPGRALCVFRQQRALSDLFSVKHCSCTLFLKSFLKPFNIPIVFLQRNVFPSTKFWYAAQEHPPILRFHFCCAAAACWLLRERFASIRV